MKQKIQLFVIVTLCMSLTAAWAQTILPVRKSRFVSVKDYAAMGQEQKASKSIGQEPWMETGNITKKLEADGLSFMVKSPSFAYDIFSMPNPIFFSKENENKGNNTVDFKMTLDFELDGAKDYNRVGLTCTFLKQSVKLSQSDASVHYISQIINFLVSKNGLFEISQANNGNFNENELIIPFTKIPFPEEPKQITINRYGPYLIFSINGKVVQKVDIANANILMAANLVTRHEKNSAVKGTIKKFTQEIFDMNYEGCITGNCQDSVSIKRVKNNIGERAFIHGQFLNGRCETGVYYYPEGGLYRGKLVNDNPPQ